MPDATIITLADAIVTSLNGASFSQSFTATRSYRPRFDLEDLATLAVTVLPTRWMNENNSRSSSLETLQVDVAVQQKVDTDSNAAVDPLMYLMGELMTHFERKQLTTPSALCITRAMIEGAEAGFSPEHMHQNFTGVIRTTWKVLA